MGEQKSTERTEGTLQTDARTTQEIETRLKEMLDRGEIGMSQYNLARQDLLKYGVRFEDLPYLFVGKELPLDLTKESRRWYNARLPRDEAVKLLKNPNITAEKLRIIREYHSTMPDEDMLLEALANMDDASFLKFMEDCKVRSNPIALSRRIDQIEKAVDTMDKNVAEVGANVGEMKNTVELLKKMFQSMKEREDAQQPGNTHSEENGTENETAGKDGEKEEGAGGLETFEENRNANTSVDRNTDVETEQSDDSLAKERPEAPIRAGQDEEADRKERQEPAPAEEEAEELKGTDDEADLPADIKPPDSVGSAGEPEQRLNPQQEGRRKPVEEETKPVEEETKPVEEETKPVEKGTKPVGEEAEPVVYAKTANRKMPSFFEKLLPGFYHPKKKDYIQLKQQERDREEHLAEMQRMADDLYAQNYMDEETYFIFCELAFKEQALDKETADVLIDGIKRGVPFSLLFKVVRNVKNSADWEASVNLLESLLNYQKQKDAQAETARKE